MKYERSIEPATSAAVRGIRGFGARVKRLREKRGLSQRDLAKLIESTQPAIVHWERGLAYPQLQFLPRIAMALDVGVVYLLLGNAGPER